MSPQYRQTSEPVRNERLVTADTIVVKLERQMIADLQQRVTRKSHRIRRVRPIESLTFQITARAPSILGNVIWYKLELEPRLS